MRRTILVFGSNLAGRHGAGAALDARRNWGAELGIGVGLTGDAYAIPTKDADLEVLPISVIGDHVETFLQFAARMPHLEFCVTKVGCGLAGYSEGEMLDLFNDAPENVVLPPGWEPRIRTSLGMTVIGPYTNLTKSGFYRVTELHPKDRQSPEFEKALAASVARGWDIAYDGPVDGVDGQTPVVLMTKKIERM